jgi:hypothetical protein
MRVRVQKNIFKRLQDVAREETRRVHDQVTVSDLVRAACYNFLLIYEAQQRLESVVEREPEKEPGEEELVVVVKTPML